MRDFYLDNVITILSTIIVIMSTIAIVIYNLLILLQPVAISHSLSLYLCLCPTFLSLFPSYSIFLEPSDPQDAEVANMYLSNYERFASTAR